MIEMSYDDRNDFHHYERVDEQQREADRRSRQIEEAERTRRYHEGLLTGNYDPYLRTLDPDLRARAIGAVTAAAQSEVRRESLRQQHLRLRATIQAASRLAPGTIAFWLSLLDQMDLSDAHGTLALLRAFRDSFQATVRGGAPRPLGGLGMNVDQLVAFASQADRIEAEMNRLGTMLEG
jgi:hypothetical protein